MVTAIYDNNDTDYICRLIVVGDFKKEFKTNFQNTIPLYLSFINKLPLISKSADKIIKNISSNFEIQYDTIHSISVTTHKSMSN